MARKMTLAELRAYNDKCRQIEYNPEIKELETKARKIRRDAHDKAYKIDKRISELRSQCDHVFNYNIGCSCLKCGFFDED